MRRIAGVVVVVVDRSAARVVTVQFESADVVWIALA